MTYVETAMYYRKEQRFYSGTFCTNEVPWITEMIVGVDGYHVYLLKAHLTMKH